MTTRKTGYPSYKIAGMLGQHQSMPILFHTCL